MQYPPLPDYGRLVQELDLLRQLKHELGADGVARVLADGERALRGTLEALKALPVNPALAAREPDGLAEIRALRPPGPRRIGGGPDDPHFADRLRGALLARMAGCILGAPVEGWPVDRMRAWAASSGDQFPPVDYWSAVTDPDALRYGLSPRRDYTRAGMDGVPVDDDLAYTLLGLLVLEEYGPDFTVDDVARAWLKYLPGACTAEKVALENLRTGVPAERAAEVENPYVEWIGADIRSDPWGYAAPGRPELAAGMAWRDACLSHRRSGVHGAMFFSAAIAAAFAMDDPLEAVRIGLTEIPADCRLAEAVRWALREAPGVGDYRAAREAVDRRFAGMSSVHTINNACLTVFGLAIGGRDVTRVLGETVAMGLDNDCTAATAGSVVGAVVGAPGVPEHWHRNFKDTVHSYLIGQPVFRIGELVQRFAAQAARVCRDGSR